MASVRYFHNRTQRKNKEVQILGRFTIDRRNRFSFSTGEKLPADCWDAVRQQAKSKYPGAMEFNQSLSKIKDDIIQLYRDNKDKPLDELQAMARALVKFGQTTEPEKKSLYPILQKYIAITKQEKDPKTAKKFEALHKVREKDGTLINSGHLWEFNKNLLINQCDNNFLQSWKQSMYDKGLIDSSVYKYVKGLKQFLIWADKHGHELHRIGDKLTHTTWEIIDRQSEVISLTLEELRKIESLNITQDLINEKLPPKKHGRRTETVEALIAARVYLVMECRTCQRISDLKAITPDQFEGMVWINKVNKGERTIGKTVKVPFNNPFTRPAYDILKAYDFQLPEVSEQKLNKNIKTVCRLAGITKEVTVTRWKQNKKIEETREKCYWISTHTGRKTFITIGLQYMVPKLVLSLAGITWKTLKHYEGDTDVEVLNEGLKAIPESHLKIAQ